MGIPLNQKKDVFLDSHVRFFEMVGGVYREVVYDNMKNVVTRFIGRNEKELNQDLEGFEDTLKQCKGQLESVQTQMEAAKTR